MESRSLTHFQFQHPALNTIEVKVQKILRIQNWIPETHINGENRQSAEASHSIQCMLWPMWRKYREKVSCVTKEMPHCILAICTINYITDLLLTTGWILSGDIWVLNSSYVFYEFFIMIFIGKKMELVENTIIINCSKRCCDYLTEWKQKCEPTWWATREWGAAWPRWTEWAWACACGRRHQSSDSSQTRNCALCGSVNKQMIKYTIASKKKIVRNLQWRSKV